MTIEKELAEFEKPKKLEKQKNYPLEQLSPRIFEILIHKIFDEEKNNQSFFNKAILMQGVGERGRDVTLYSNSNPVATIQCKHSQNNGKRYTVNEVGNEIIKFILHYLQDKSLIHDLDSFIYYFATNTNLNEDATNMILSKETFISNKHLFLKWIKNCLRDYKKLKLKNNDEMVNSVLDTFSKIEIEVLTKEKINEKIEMHKKEIAPLFFEVMSVADNRYVKNIKKILKDSIEPKLNFLIEKDKMQIKKQSYLEGLTRYLNNSANHFSYMRTIVFGSNRQKLNDLYVPLTLYSPMVSGEFKMPFDIVRLFNKSNKILISSTAGMGKSTIVKKLFLHLIEKTIATPIFIELKRLNKSGSIASSIIKKLKPIYGRINAEGLFAMIEKGGFVFIFDGFDEIEDEYKQTVVENLIDFIRKSEENKFVITSRPETALATFADFQEMRVKDLKLNEAIKVLENYGNSLEHSDELIDKIKTDSSGSISDFLKNPLLVSLLYKAYEYKRIIPYKKHLFYSQVYDALFQNHDLTKEGFTRAKKSGLDINTFESILRYIAYKTAIKRKSEYLYSELISLIEKARNYHGLSFSPSEYVEDLTNAVPLFTKEGNYYNWSHKSLQDYFSAKFIQIDCPDKQESILNKIYESDFADRFENILDILYELDYKCFRNTILFKISEDYINYSNDNYTGYSNLESNFVKFRKSINFQRQIDIGFYKNNKNINSSVFENYEANHRVYTKNGLLLIRSNTDKKYYFLDFLGTRNNNIISKISKRKFESLDFVVDDKDYEMTLLIDDRKLWFNKDKFHFEKITEILLTLFPYRINHDSCIRVNKKIKEDIKIKESEDLLQFE